MAKNDFEHSGWNYYTLQCGTIMACGSGFMTVNSPSGSTCNVTRSSGIMTLNSPGGSTLQCGRWLWDDMPWNSPKRTPCWNSTSGFDFDLITAVDVSFCTSLQNFIQIGPPSAEKMTSCRFLRRQISAILDFRGRLMGSLKSPCTTSYVVVVDVLKSSMRPVTSSVKTACKIHLT